MVPEITVIAEHSVALNLLPEKALILDAGCRGFEFTRFFREHGHSVVALDIDDLGTETLYVRAGISSVTGKAKVHRHPDPQARHLMSKEIAGTYTHIESDEVYVFTLEDLEKGQRFDLIKLDVEGEELSILKQVKHPMAGQVSVEFHAHCTLQTRAELDSLLSWLELWYTIHNRVWESRHGAGFNYWDVLLIAK